MEISGSNGTEVNPSIMPESFLEPITTESELTEDPLRKETRIILFTELASDPTVQKEYGKRLKYCREGHGFLQQTLAGCAGITAQAVSKIENGFAGTINVRYLNKFARFLECSPYYLLALTDHCSRGMASTALVKASTAWSPGDWGAEPVTFTAIADRADHGLLLKLKQSDSEFYEQIIQLARVAYNASHHTEYKKVRDGLSGLLSVILDSFPEV